MAFTVGSYIPNLAETILLFQYTLFVCNDTKSKYQRAKCLAQNITLASYNTLALVGSGSKHRTRSPL